jgi:TonB family protein
LAICFGSLLLAEKSDSPAVLLKSVQPDWGAPATGYLVDVAQVEMTVDPAGKPFALKSSTGLPEPVVTALEQWQYSPYKQNGHAVPFTAKINVAVRRPLTPSVESGLRATWNTHAKELRDAIKEGDSLDQAKAAELEAHLPDAEAMGNPRTALLEYYTEHAPAGPETVAARARLILWLIGHDPQDEILGSRLAIINATGEPLADAPNHERETNAWLEALKQYPNDALVSRHALNFLRIAAPAKAIETLHQLTTWNQRGIWIGNVYALAILGVTALDPKTGDAVDAAETAVPQSLRTSMRSALLSANDPAVVLAAMLALDDSASSLSRSNKLPPVFNEFCPQLLAHAKAFYPGTSASCEVDDVTKAAHGSSDVMERIGGKLAEARLTHRVQPVYPAEAKSARVQGTVEYWIMVNELGEIEEIGFISGPLVFYRSALMAVRQWRYDPVRLNGQPVKFVTTVTVNYTMSG